MKKHLNLFVVGAIAAFASTGCESFQKPGSQDPVRRDAFNGENLDGWREPVGNWTAVGGVALHPENPKSFSFEPGFGVLVNGTSGPTRNLVSTFEHADVELHIEFNVPEGSNSGVYFQGRYEIQVLDSHGVEKPQHSDCGGIYQRWKDDKGFDGHPPAVNASKPPGEWQYFDVLFRAPRYDEFGTKIANARFVSVRHNGVEIHRDVELTGPTRAALDENTEVAFGPLMLQGDHGPVAYRNIIVRDVLLD
ncbi:MAG TPA: hypothetical protein DCY13_07600 [Verrucomicrobiales bacterium]|nr:hypothetical protein [Verrucomicrobiales bacterium]